MTQGNGQYTVPFKALDYGGVGSTIISMTARSRFAQFRSNIKKVPESFGVITPQMDRSVGQFQSLARRVRGWANVPRSVHGHSSPDILRRVSSGGTLQTDSLKVYLQPGDRRTDPSFNGALKS